MEKRLTFLPKPIRSVIIPETFTVSQITSIHACLLKSVIDTQSYFESRLKPSPYAELGKLSHALVESSVSDALHGKPLSNKEIERKFMQMIFDYKINSKGDLNADKAIDLTMTMTPLAWKRKKRTIVDLALDYSSRTRRIKITPPRTQKKMFRFQDAQGNGRWIEVPIDVPDLRLKGRMDILERKNGELSITDLKFGDIKDAEGLLKPEIVLQLRLYGLMAIALDKNANISLFVNDGELNPVPFDSKIAQETEVWLRSLTDKLPPGAIVQSEELSKVSLDCRWCQYRHRCAKYLYEVPNFWSRATEWRLPLDTWGRVDKLSMGDGLAEIVMTDAGGRLVKIFGVRDYHLSEVAIGSYLWMFNLAASRASRSSHPLNFHEVNMHDELDQAWSFHIFVGRDQM